MDLLQGRYGLATNNINASDVATVQVLEHHQPIKALQDKSLTDDVAINLKLKNAAKGTVAINTMVGGGWQQSGPWRIGSRPLTDGQTVIGSNPLWTAEVVGMYFAKKRQNMTLYKAYHHDDIRREGTSESDRFISDDSRLLTSETLTSQTHLNDLSGNLRYMWNAKDGFLANVIKFDGSWNNDKVEGLLASQLDGPQPINYGSERTHQHFDRPSLAVSNTTNLIKNIRSHTLDLHFSAGYAQRPNTLTVGIDSLNAQQTVFNSQYYQQDINSRHINANFHTNYNFHFGYFTLSYGIIANASLHGITTDLDGFTPPAASRKVVGGETADHTDRNNDLWYNTYELTLGQHYKWERGGWRISLGCPLNLYTQTLDDRVRDDKHSYVHLLVSPTFSTSYEWRDWSGNIGASYHRNVGDPGGIYSGYIMNNYRSFQRSYVEQLSETDRVGISASIGYRSALNATFFRLNATPATIRFTATPIKGPPALYRPWIRLLPQTHTTSVSISAKASTGYRPRFELSASTAIHTVNN